LLWLESIGLWHHPAYRLALAVSTFSWFAYIVWTPKPAQLPRPLPKN
jgi:hypothetical protein